MANDTGTFAANKHTCVRARVQIQVIIRSSKLQAGKHQGRAPSHAHPTHAHLSVLFPDCRNNRFTDGLAKVRPIYTYRLYIGLRRFLQAYLLLDRFFGERHCLCEHGARLLHVSYKL